MPSGFSIILAGEHFDAEGFLKSTPRPELPWEATSPACLELWDIAKGPFPLNLTWELEYFFEQCGDELRQALDAPGVDCRNLHIFNEGRDSSVTEYSFTNAQLKQILDFGWDVTFNVTGIDSRDWSVGSRILVR